MARAAATRGQSRAARRRTVHLAAVSAERALSDDGIKEVVIGLDFEYFLAPDGWYQDPAKEGTEFDHRLAVTRQGIPNQFWRRQRLIDVGQALALARRSAP